MNKKLALSAVLSAAAIAGCGGSSSSSSSASGADFVAKANSVCASVNNQIAQLPAITDVSSAKTTVPQELTVIKQGISKFKALAPPSDQQTAVTTYIGQLQTEAVLSGKLMTAVTSGDSATAQQIDAQGKALQSQNQAAARKLGLTECVKDSPPGSANSSASSTG